ncbi:unnamed protein product (macronuclear) [Paramecium tetraurelia]|uniref:Uncharacterized protein n=1 Tax=Paramecium tetraurelia TaxID=5888 RepID=A0DKR2_PARTE|nr:uncharacterized protein GSPATT00017959001 [Paramecium tetraurelia]CAK83629.1 unnamed protein product [Paramecium tetraurelia]|eukprot:XP_001451026.1 hypothetical protein (macronuclear) [Paramecium tetraurelia strain d4-2]
MSIKKMNNFFKADKTQSNENKKYQSSFNGNQQQSINNALDLLQNQSQQRKGNFMEGIQMQKKNEVHSDQDSNSSSEAGLLQTKKLQKIMEEDYDNEGQSAKMSESTIQRYQHLKKQRVGNANIKYQDEINNSKMNNSKTYTKQDDSRHSNSQDSFEPNIPISRRHTDRQEQLAKQMNYFKPQQSSQQAVSDFKLEIGIQVSQLDSDHSKSSIEQSSEISSKDYQRNENHNLLRLLDKNTQPRFSQQQSQQGNYDQTSNQPEQTQLNFEQNCNPILSHLSKLQANNIPQKARLSLFSQKTVPNSASQQYSQFSQQNQFQYCKQGIVLNTCKSLSGDIFTLRPGNKVVVVKIDQEKKLIQCGYQNMLGLFYLRDIAIKDESQQNSKFQIKSRTQSSFEMKYKELLNDKYNARSKSPNNRSFQAQSKTPTKRPFMRF